MHLSVVLIGPGGEREQPLNRLIDLCCSAPVARLIHQPLGKLGAARLEILGNVVEDLGARVGSRPRPGSGPLSRLHRVSNVLSVPRASLAQQLSRRTTDLLAVPRIGSRLLPADVLLGRPVNPWRGCSVVGNLLGIG